MEDWKILQDKYQGGHRLGKWPLLGQKGYARIEVHETGPNTVKMKAAYNNEAKTNSNLRDKMSMYFSDGKRKIDYVLAYETQEGNGNDEISASHTESARRSVSEKQTNKRLQYEANLRSLGLELEHVDAKYCKRTHFVLIHAPFSLLIKQAECLSLKMPVFQSDVKERTIFEGVMDRFLARFKFLTYDRKTNERLKEPNYFTAPFIAAHLDCYVGNEDHERFFDSSERSRLVYDLLIRTRYDAREAEKYRVGIERLINNGSYTAAFPLHERCDWCNYDVDTATTRELLWFNWARFSNFYKYQPLTLIKKYFGSKIGMYFAWLGYYTKVLFPAALLGILCFLYGLSTFSQDIPSNDICGSDGVGATIIMCPTCSKYCDFTRLNSSCLYSKLTYIFDNDMTVVFAAAMSIFATLFLEGWKRYHSEVAWKWGLLDFEVDEETVRPEYQLRVKTMKAKRFNPVTQQMEPYMPLRSRLLRFFGSGVTVLFFLLLVIAFVVGIIVYRIVLVQVFYRMDSVKPVANILTFTTAATLNLAVILVMSYFYTYLALKLTDWECPRTQADFDNSYTFKVYLFQFINYYSSIFYIAFIKGNLSSVPGRQLLGLRPEECDPAGCMVELVIQLAIIMCGKQFWNAFVELAWPLVMTWVRKLRIGETKRQKSERIRYERQMQMSRTHGEVPQWEKDYVLNPVYEQFLFEEYLEMVIQFGFVTLFVSAFPLAPFFALLNNIIEIRIDAYKYIVATRRPMPERARDIGIWLPILGSISRAAVLVNALIIAFTSDFIPKLVYQVVYNHPNLLGYVNNSLSVYDAAGIDVQWNAFQNKEITECRFRDYRKPPCSLNMTADCDDNYDVTMQWWIVLAFRLAFVLIFEHIVAGVKALVAYVIPDIPTQIFIQLQRQRFLARQARISDIGNTARSGKETVMPSSSKELTDVVFQPGDFDETSENVSPEMEAVMKRHSLLQRRGSLRSALTLDDGSFYSCSAANSPLNHRSMSLQN